jgi:outer membrane protein assembly factor BamA
VTDEVSGTSVAEGPSKPDPQRRIGEVFALHRALPDTSTFKVGPYRTHFSVDYASAGGFFASNVGLAAQTVLVFSDVLGNHNIVVGASVYGSISESDLLFQYANLSHRTNYGVSLFQLRDDFFLTTAENRDEFVSQIYRGVDVTLSRPFSRFRRVELTLEGLQVSEKVYREVFLDSDIFSADPTEESNLYFARPGLALVRDNALYGVTGPISGGRSRLSADVSFGDIQSSRFILDRRSYLNLRQRFTLAARVIGATSQGRDPLLFRVGGPWTIRGYEYGEFDGHHVGIVNLEFRFPLIETLQLGWPLPLGLRGVRGALFFDAGSAWSRHDHYRAFRSDGAGFRTDDIHAAYGLSAAINIGFAILRWELAQPTNLRDNTGKIHGVFTIGSDF